MIPHLQLCSRSIHQSTRLCRHPATQLIFILETSIGIRGIPVHISLKAHASKPRKHSVLHGNTQAVHGQLRPQKVQREQGEGHLRCAYVPDIDIPNTVQAICGIATNLPRA